MINMMVYMKNHIQENQCLQGGSGEGFVIFAHSFHFFCREPPICSGVSSCVCAFSVPLD